MTPYLNILVLEIALGEVIRGYLTCRTLPEDYFDRIDYDIGGFPCIVNADSVGRMLSDCKVTLATLRNEFPNKLAAESLIKKTAMQFASLTCTVRQEIKHAYERDFLLAFAAAMMEFVTEEGATLLLREAVETLRKVKIRGDDMHYGPGYFDTICSN